MNLELVGKDVTASPELKARIASKVEKFEARLGRKLLVRVTLGKVAAGYTCAVHFALNRHEFNAHAEAEDLFRSTDEAFAKVSRQLRKHLDAGHKRTHDSIRNTLDTDELTA